MGDTSKADQHEEKGEVEKEEKHEKVDEEKEEKKKKEHDEGEEKEEKKKKDKKEKKKKSPEDNKDAAKLKQKLEKVESKIQALVAKKEEILKLIKEAEQGATPINVLYKDFAQQPKIYEIDYQCCGWSFDLSCKIQDIVPGLSALVGLVLPHSGKVELQYMQDYFGVTGGIGLKADPAGVFSPLLNFSGVVGTSLFSFGTGLAFDLGTRAFDKFNTGLSFNNDLLNSSLTLDKLDTLKASCYYTVNPQTNTAIAAELKHSFSTNDTSFAVGARHDLFPLTVLKGKIDTQGKVAAMIQQGLWDKFFINIGGEVDFMDQGRVPNIGLSMAIRV